MSETKHTPGPWRAHEDNERIPMMSEWRVSAPGSLPGYTKPICRMHLQGLQSKANAALIAAAPDLLEALQFYMSICGNTAYAVSRESAQEMHAKGQAAIAKAKGEHQ